MKTFTAYGTFLVVISLCIGFSLATDVLHHPAVLGLRYPRSPNGDCKYEKGPWQECDATNGVQKRTLTLRTARAVSVDCPREKSIERPCKKQCKYTKGIWSECANGSKERVDKLRENVSTSGCKPEKQITKTCKKQCAYEKSEWGPCENGVKTKTLTIQENATNSPDCESAKTITKVCTKGPKAKRLRKKNREQVEG